jgi:hypothetical protein
MFPRSFDGLRRIVCALRCFAHIDLRSCLFSARSCHGFFHMSFRLLWKWTHTTAGKEPDTGIFARTVKYDCAFLRDCAIKACFWMRLDHADEILLPWIAFKVGELFNNLAQVRNAHALQRFLDGSPPLFTQSFHIYKFIEWHRWCLSVIMFEIDTSMGLLSEKTRSHFLV